MKIFLYLIFGIYTFALLYITIFCLLQIHLLFLYIRNHRIKETPLNNHQDWPVVTIQLPLYNEMYVADRLIDCIAAFDYPKEKLEIQILDDSTDETIEIVNKKVTFYRAQGLNIYAHRRASRTGFKAGALAEGMKVAKGTYMAIFDADFLPRPDFLLKTIPFFEDAQIAAVQTRWEHINETHSLLTRLQALQLNVHFTVEQVGRQAGSLFLQFNGTAGVWRKTAIDDAGGWQPDTITEDLDLSYRAQLRNWKIKYLEGVGSPAELPAEMIGIKSQQYRWMKGGAETARKILPSLWKSPNFTFMQKLHGTFHLMASGIFFFVFVAGILSVPVMAFSAMLGDRLNWLSFLLVAMLSVISVYYVANVFSEINRESWLRKVLKFAFLFPLFLALSMGLSLHNSIAVIQGWLGKKTAFVRTPKFNIKSVEDTFRNRVYQAKKIPLTTYVEVLLAIYFIASVAYSLYEGIYFMLFYHILLAIGFGSISYYSIRHKGT